MDPDPDQYSAQNEYGSKTLARYPIFRSGLNPDLIDDLDRESGSGSRQAKLYPSAKYLDPGSGFETLTAARLQIRIYIILGSWAHITV